MGIGWVGVWGLVRENAWGCGRWPETEPKEATWTIPKEDRSKRRSQARKLVAGAGFEPAIPRRGIMSLTSGPVPSQVETPAALLAFPLAASP